MRAKILAGAALVLALFIGPSQSATTYTYDNLGRVWIVTYDNGMQITYSYDAAGNRTSVVSQTGSGLPPQAVNDSITAYGTTPVTFNPLTNDSDPSGYSLSITGVGTPVVTGSTATYTSTSVTYTAKSGYTGPDQFTYTIYDGHGHYASATIYATDKTGSPPIANNVSASTPLNTAVNITPLTADTDPHGYTLTISVVGTPTHGTATINSGTSITYTPTTGYVGADSFSYTISDGHGQTASATISVNIGSPPVAVPVSTWMAENTASTFDPRVNDSDPNGLSLNVTTLTTPSHGTATIVDSETQVTHTPSTGFTGSDLYNYTITNTAGLTATSTVSVCVGPTAPTLGNYTTTITKFIYGGGTWTPQSTFDPAVNATISCGWAPTITSVTQGAHGSVYISATGSTVTYVYYEAVHTNYELYPADSFTFTITDPFSNTATATVTVNIDVENSE